MIFAGFKFRTDILFFCKYITYKHIAGITNIYYGYEKED